MSDQPKRRIEAAYRREERTIEAGVDRVGQMTVAFCGGHPTGGGGTGGGSGGDQLL